jgi:drug/metabolite transporter (DMT)-like permease
MKIIESIVVWGLFLGCSVFGHVALKRAAGSSDRFEWGRALWLWKDPWAMGAGLSWMVSCFLWALLLTRLGVGEATSQSAVRYVLILAAASIWLGESFSTRQTLGCALIAIGIWMTSRK